MLSTPTPQASPSCDPYVIERLVLSMGAALEHACIKDITTPAEVLSAIFTVLDRTLSAIRDLESPTERNDNAKEVAKTLQAMMMEHGMVLQ